MNEGQERDYRYLIDKGAKWVDAMDYCHRNRPGDSAPDDLNFHLATLLVLQAHEQCFGGCDCGWTYPNPSVANHDEHLAEVIEGVLGV